MNPDQGFMDAFADALEQQWDSTTIDADGTINLAQWPITGLVNNQTVIANLVASWQTGANLGAAISVNFNPRPTDAIHYARARAAEMAGMRLLPNGNLIVNPNPKWSLSDTTRDKLRELVDRYLDQTGDVQAAAPRDLKAAIAAMPEFAALFGEYRAEMIARSELAMANNSGNLDAMQSSDIPMVYVLDNPTCKICGPVAGTTQTLEWARDNLIGHPHCIRAFNAVHVRKDAGGAAGGAAGAAGGGIGVGTGLQGHEIEGQKPPRCPMNCRGGKRPNGRRCKHPCHSGAK